MCVCWGGGGGGGGGGGEGVMNGQLSPPLELPFKKSHNYNGTQKGLEAISRSQGRGAPLVPSEYANVVSDEISAGMCKCTLVLLIKVI